MYQTICNQMEISETSTISSETAFIHGAINIMYGLRIYIYIWIADKITFQFSCHAQIRVVPYR